MRSTIHWHHSQSHPNMEADAAQSNVPDEVGRDLVTIRTQAERISRVTRSILTFSRGTVSMLKPLDLNCVARTCVAMAGERMTGLLCGWTWIWPRRCRRDGDRDRLETVLLNVINNAIDAVTASGEHGVVTVRTARVQINGDEGADQHIGHWTWGALGDC